jgi:O-antigen chain-terminating methyltransferase
VKALIREIQERVAANTAAGLYPPELTAELVVTETDRLRGALSDARASAVLSANVSATSERPVVGPFIAATKRIMIPFVRWYIAAALAQVEAFATRTLTVVGLLTERVADTESRLSALEAAERPVHEGASSGGVVGWWPRGWDADSSIDYVEFEEQFRGSSDEIQKRQRSYAEYFRGVPAKIVDLGCGRGEFLKVLRDQEMPAYGVDRHPAMVARCREQGLEVIQADVIEHLESLAPRSLGGIFAAQLVEHLTPAGVARLFELAGTRLMPGGVLLVETINPQSLFVFANALYVDLGHIRPIHSFSLRFLAEHAGLSRIELVYGSEPPADRRLAELSPSGEARAGAMIDQLNENFRRINQLLFGPQDYALVARR